MLNPYRHLTIFALIALNVLVFAAEWWRHDSWSADYGAVPAFIAPAFRELWSGDWSAAAVKDVLRLATALFLHGSPEHIVFNMVFLWTFGFLTSDALGQWWALGCFLLTGICGNIAQVALNADSPVAIVGASGAVCGLQGIYLGLALKWRLPDAEVWPLAHAVPPMQLVAFAVIGFIGDIVLFANHDEQIAYGAHLGGLAAGVAIAAMITTLYPTIDAYRRGWR